MWTLLKYMLLLSTMDWHSLLNIQTLGELVSSLHNLKCSIHQKSTLKLCFIHNTNLGSKCFQFLLYMHISFDCIWRIKTDVFESQ